MRVLVVEDFPALRQSLVQGLTQAGFAVDASGDGEEGLWYAQLNPYDALVLDLMLPGLDGLSLLRRLRTQGNRVHVLLLTARDQIDDRIAGLDAGADDYLVKPFALGELVARLRALIRRTYGTKNPHLDIADLRVDTTTRRAYRAGRELALTPREYALLEYLASRVGETVSREDIREHLYDFAADAESNVINVYVGYLRRKLERDGESPLLHTVRGTGYRLGVLP